MRSLQAVRFLLVIGHLLPMSALAFARDSGTENRSVEVAKEILERMRGHEEDDTNDPKFRKAVADLAEHGPSIFCGLIHILKTRDDVADRAAAAQVILAIEDDRRPLLPVLRELAAHEDPSARGLSGVMLGRIGEPEDVDLLLPMLNDEDALVRHTAAKSLAMLGRAETADRIEGILEERVAPLTPRQRELDTSIKAAQDAIAALRWKRVEGTPPTEVEGPDLRTPWRTVVAVSGGVAALLAGACIVLRRKRRLP